jgi:hypothetical protein
MISDPMVKRRGLVMMMMRMTKMIKLSYLNWRLQILPRFG